MVVDKDLEELQEDIGQKVESFNILFLDLSASCTGYSLVTVNFAQKKATFTNAGVIWFNDDWSNQEKYHYLFAAITNYFNIVGQVDYCVAEAYMINQNKMMGSHVGPELHGVLQVSLAEIGVKYKTILPQTWRSLLGIKPTVTLDKNGKKKRDYKLPTKTEVTKVCNTIPAQIVSNITGNTRATPSDLYDALAISMGFLQKIGIKNRDFSSLEIQGPINIV
jgi:Holliday junction resolvasome RuvABC endonuclease subunit